MTDDARIRELMLVNLFAVFSEREPERRLKVIAAGGDVGRFNDAPDRRGGA